MDHQPQVAKNKSKKRSASKSSRAELSATSSNADEPIRSTPEKTGISAGRPSDSEKARMSGEKRQSPKRTAPTTSQTQHRHSRTLSLQTNPASLKRHSGAKHETAGGQAAGANTSALGKAALSSLSTSTSTGGGTFSSESSPKPGDPGEAATDRRSSQPAPVNVVRAVQVADQGALQLEGRAAVDVPQGKRDSAPKTEKATPMIESAQKRPQLGVQPVEAESLRATKQSTHAETRTATTAGTPPATGQAFKPGSETETDAKTETQQPKQVEQQTSGTPPSTRPRGKPSPVMVDSATQSCLPTAVPPSRRNAAVDTKTDAPADFWAVPCAEPELPFASVEYMSPPAGAAVAKVAPVGGQRKADRKCLESTITGCRPAAGGGRKSAAVTSEAGAAVTTEATIMMDVNPYVRYPLLTMNLLIWLMGLTLLLVGAYAYVDTWTQTDIPSSSTTYNIYSMFVIKMEITVMLFGMVTMSLSFCGCVGALRENTCLLNVYSSFITALLLLNLLAGLVVFFLPSQIKKLLSETFSMELIVHYRDSPDFQRLMDSIQERMQCCGISKRNFRDWNANMYFNCSRANPSSERCSVPYSCCKRNTTEQVVSLSCGRNVLNMTDYDAWFQVYTGNCLDSAHRYVRENVTIITGLCLVFVIVLAFVQMVTQALIDEIQIIRRIYEKFYERAFDIRAAQELQTEPSAN